MKEQRPISLHELLYPLIQGYDSVALRADVEMCGSDQKFNCLVGRVLQQEAGQEPAVIVSMPLLEGLDGVKKMSKSLGNYVGVTDSGSEMLGKLMSIPDGLIIKYFELLTAVPEAEIAEMNKSLGSGANPRDLKMRLAKTVVSMYHSPEAAVREEELFNKKFRDKTVSVGDIAEAVALPAWDSTLEALSAVSEDRGLGLSKTELRRLLAADAVSVDAAPIGLQFSCPAGEHILKIGKKSIFKLRVGR
jgi:tyrosyl-tRNA synthetase